MNCQEVESLIDGYLDGELGLAGNLEIERHLRSCPACKQAHENRQALSAAVRGSNLTFQPPGHLQKRLRLALHAEAKGDASWKMRDWRWAYAGASIIALSLLILAFFPGVFPPATDDAQVQEVVAGHVRSLMADHLTDIPSSDRHTVKPWFNGKLDFAPPVIDLANQGFTLTGGRLDYLQNRSVAALIYQRQQHSINLFIWPSSQTAKTTSKLTRQGYNLTHWTASGLTWWAISDLNGAELEEFAAAIKAKVPASSNQSER